MTEQNETLTQEQLKYLDQLSDKETVEKFREYFIGQAKHLPEIMKGLKEQYVDGWVEKGQWGDYYSDDGSIFEVVDSEGQRLWFRYGPVFNNLESESPGEAGDAIWVYYQRWSLRSDMKGPVLMSLGTFEELIKYYKEHKRRTYS